MTNVVGLVAPAAVTVVVALIGFRRLDYQK